ncbi:hypothetical protein AC629_06900 [Bradyrhizobium sp. NAS80.1]|nr:hypothetical protein AC629_06900 [Bradyrhizobium sp. NAS80.1]
MKGRTTSLDTSLTLLAVAIILALLDVAVATQRSTSTQPEASTLVRNVTLAPKTEQCAPALPPELRDMIGRD